MRKKIVSFLSVVSLSLTFAPYSFCVAGPMTDYEKKIAERLWTPTVSENEIKCQAFNLPETACVGTGVCNHSGNDGLGRSNLKKKQSAVLVLLATELAEHGAKFCAVQINATRNSGWEQPWVRTYWPEGNRKVCFWVCTDGYGGDSCNIKNTTFVDDAGFENVRKSLESLIVAKDTGTNIMKLTDRYEKVDPIYQSFGKLYCFGGKEHATHFHTAHALFYGVLDFTKDGHGVITTPMGAWSSTPSAGSTRTQIEVHATDRKVVMCATGYRPVGDSCELNPWINEDSNTGGNGGSDSGGNGGSDSGGSGASNAGPCSGWESFPTTGSYKKYYVSEKKCYEYRCFDGSEGFRSSSDRTCVSCTGSTKKGVNVSGVCTTCSGDMVFDKIGKKCRQPAEYTKQDLLYGRNKTVTSADLANQCWTKTIPSEYEQCVVDKTISSTLVKTDFVVGTIGVAGVTVDNSNGSETTPPPGVDVDEASKPKLPDGESGWGTGGSTPPAPDDDEVGNIDNNDAFADQENNNNGGYGTGGGLNGYKDSLDNNLYTNH